MTLPVSLTTNFINFKEELRKITIVVSAEIHFTSKQLKYFEAKKLPWAVLPVFPFPVLLLCVLAVPAVLG